MRPVVVSWSGGKDSALALHALKTSPEFKVVGLLTTFTHPYERVSMHGVRRELILRQAQELNLPLYESWIDQGATNAKYEAAMEVTLSSIRKLGISTMIFGDLYLEEIRTYREALMKRFGVRSEFPLWGQNTASLLNQFIHQGFRAKVCCVDTQQVPAEFCGMDLDEQFQSILPVSADPCGENGEFHSFVYDCPIMNSSIEIELGEIRQDGQFVFRDINFAAATQTKSPGE